MSIPKIIHYCWFGEDEMPEKEKECIKTWKKIFKDYEIKKWDESNFDYSSCEYARQAYEQKEYAFVSDYARTKVLFEEGGIYLDTDVEMIKQMPELAGRCGFLGFERRQFLGTAVVGVEPGNPIIKQWMDYYLNHSFLLEDGTPDRIANVSVITDIMKEKGLVLGGERQTVDGFEIFGIDAFYPRKINDEKFNVTANTVAVHRCSNSWMSEREKRRGKNIIWRKVIRPFLRSTRKASRKIVGKETSRYIEIKMRDKLK